jgi:membrane protein
MAGIPQRANPYRWGMDQGDARAAAEAAAAEVEGRARGFGRAVDLWQQRHPVIAFPWSVYRKFADDSGSRFAAQLAYYALFSIAPLLLVFMVGVGRLLQDNPALRDSFVEATFGAVPELAEAINNAIANLPDTGAPLAIGLIATLYAGLGLTESAQFAFNQIWAVPWRIRPGFFPRQFRALAMTLLFYTGLMGYGLVAAWAGLATNQTMAVRVLVVLTAAAVFFGVVLLSYWVLCGRKLTFWQIWPGTVAFLGITIVVIPFLSGLFAKLVADASSLYGALAGVIAFLTLLYLTAVLFILTAEINVVRTWRLWPRALFPDWLSHADRKSYSVLAPVEERMPEQRVITYFGVLEDRHNRELGPEVDPTRFRYVDTPPPFVRADADTVLMDYYVEGREPDVVINPYRPEGTTEPADRPSDS